MPKVIHTVTGTLSLLRANHPEDCMSCDVNGKCEFQDLINRYQVRFQGFLVGALV
jgi:NADH-quinone oxidoreductase subunit G